MMCTIQTAMNEPIGAPCAYCGHTNLVHPGPQNPALDTCVTCALLAMAAAIKAGLS